VRSGEELDWARLERHLRQHLPEFDGAFEVLQFPNGSANLTYLLRFGATELVMRRPPFGVLAPGAHDMRREFRVLSKLWRWFDKAPRGFLFCDDREVVGSDFVVMERRVGEVVRGAGRGRSISIPWLVGTGKVAEATATDAAGARGSTVLRPGKA
jgi:aminoglycoside phosphotransferase (APT) family kinase protein